MFGTQRFALKMHKDSYLSEHEEKVATIWLQSHRDDAVKHTPRFWSLPTSDRWQTLPASAGEWTNTRGQDVGIKHSATSSKQHGFY